MPLRKGLARFALGALLAPAAHSQSIEPPDLRAGDSWTYQVTSERGSNGWVQVRQEISITRVTATTVFLSVHQSGSTQPPRELFVTREWGRVRDVNGKETMVNKPLVFPLKPGKSWTLAYEEQNPNKHHTRETWDNRYTVVGWEDIEVPAGHFKALKIEAEGTWRATVAPGAVVSQGAETTAQGTAMSSTIDKTSEHETSERLYKAIWYVPEIKRWVKSIDENYSSTGLRNERFTDELVAYKPGHGE